MPLNLLVKTQHCNRSERVKCVDLHPSEHWMLTGLYDGTAHIWNYASQVLCHSYEVSLLPVRAAKFIPRKNWLITGSDDRFIRVFNYNTRDSVVAFDAHSDYIRCIVIHPTQPFVLSASDDSLIKLWNWEKRWCCEQVFEGHTHYVMQIVINSKCASTFASASLDCTLKVWQLGFPTPNYTLKGHTKGVNCVDYHPGFEKPYLISGGDDNLIKIWDYQNKVCIQTLVGHTQNISSVAFHPELPIILSGAEDGTVRVWHSNTYNLENTLNYNFERVWSIVTLNGSNNVGFGCDEGSLLVKFGHEHPVISMDISGKLIWAKNFELRQANLRSVNENIADGEKLPVVAKTFNTCDIYPLTISHSSNGRFVALCGEGEYVIYTAVALRSKVYGQGEQFVWSHDPSEYAVRENGSQLKVFKNFKEKKILIPLNGCKEIYGGCLLSVSSTNGLTFYDWDTLQLISTIEIHPKDIIWSENSRFVCIITSKEFYILRYNADLIDEEKISGNSVQEDGYENAFEMLSTHLESVTTGLWIEDCFIYINTSNILNYFVGGKKFTIAYLDRVMYLLGYIKNNNRVFLVDKQFNIVSYFLSASVLEYQTNVMRGELEAAKLLLPSIPSNQRTNIANFLEKQGLVAEAFSMATDTDYKFELALKLKNLSEAYSLAINSKLEGKWKMLADLASSKCDFKLAAECLYQANDYGGLLILASSSGDADLLEQLCDITQKNEIHNIAFMCCILLGKKEKALNILVQNRQFPEAAFFAYSYLPSQVSRIVKLWKESLVTCNERISQALADPEEYDNLFPSLLSAIKTEETLQQNCEMLKSCELTQATNS